MSALPRRTSDKQDKDLDIIWLCSVRNCTSICKYLVHADTYLETKLDHEQDKQNCYCEADTDDNMGVAHYVDAICTTPGYISSWGFAYKDCSVYDNSIVVDQCPKKENWYSLKLSYHMLEETFATDKCITSCVKVNNDGKGIEN